MNCDEIDKYSTKQPANRNCYKLSRVSWALAQIFCFTLQTISTSDSCYINNSRASSKQVSGRSTSSHYLCMICRRLVADRLRMFATRFTTRFSTGLRNGNWLYQLTPAAEDICSAAQGLNVWRQHDPRRNDDLAARCVSIQTRYSIVYAYKCT